jgi:DGQHR domain-containing protein
MMKLPVTRFTQVHEGGVPVELYLTVLTVDQLMERAKIDVRKPGATTGYQREPTESRVREIARYVTTQGGIMPTAVLVNIRDGARFEEQAPDSTLGWLHIPDAEPFWIEDGQHRYYGLELAKNKYGFEVEKYDIPVVFTTVPYQEELRLFYVVNAKAKSVPTDLTATLLMEQAVEKISQGERVKVNEVRKAVGVYIAQRLAQEPGPWHGKIRLPNEDKSVIKQKPVSVSTFASTLRAFLADKWVQRRYQGTDHDSQAWRNLYEVVRNYWIAIQELMPEATANVERYSVQKPLGTWVFHDILPDVVDLARRAGDWSPKYFRSQLERLEEWVRDSTWDMEGSEPIVRANNRQAIEYLTGQMRQLFVETPGLHDAEDALPQGSAPAAEVDLS